MSQVGRIVCDFPPSQPTAILEHSAVPAYKGFQLVYRSPPPIQPLPTSWQLCTFPGGGVRIQTLEKPRAGPPSMQLLGKPYIPSR